LRSKIEYEEKGLCEEKGYKRGGAGPGKTGDQVLAEILDKNYAGEQGSIRKELEKLVEEKIKAEKALRQIEVQIQEKIEEFNEVRERRFSR
jgi:hypothetical protein